MPKTVNIPAYYIELNTGLILLRDLENIVRINQANPQKNLVNRVTLTPSSKPVLDHWQFALVVVGVMLLTSIIAICKVDEEEKIFLFIKLTLFFFSFE